MNIILKCFIFKPSALFECIVWVNFQKSRALVRQWFLSGNNQLLGEAGMNTISYYHSQHSQTP